MDVRVEGLRFERNRRVVLDVPSLVIRPDRTTVILGPNGAGKTTLLRMIAGLERPTAGRVDVGGVEVVPGRARDVAYVFQELVFLRGSVRQNLELGLKLRNVPKDEREARIGAAARVVGIESVLDRRADQLSGGEGKRVGIARALCLRSSLVLLDEPLSGLDPATYMLLLDELPDLLHAFGATSVLVTHNHTEALRLAEDIIVIVDGRVRAAGDRHTVFLDPGDAVVARLLGYTVVTTGDRRVAVREDALTPGPGPIEFSGEVESLRDLVDYLEAVCSINGTRVRVRLPPDVTPPTPGERLLIHADRACEVRGAP
jgi:ABC-type sugar transport system ATPase subunit